MFRRNWESLPPDPEFPSSLSELGYFVNENDEIRSLENEDTYFKFFINKNERFCYRQRFVFNQAVQDVIHRRLIDLGLNHRILPASVTNPSQPHVNIFVSANIGEKSRVVVIFGETDQDLGVLSHRVIGSRGGVNKGSLVSTVKALQHQQSSSTDPSAPGIILANMGELLWWPKGKRTLSIHAFKAAPMRSAAHTGNAITNQNYVPGNENPAAHVKNIFEYIVPSDLNENACLDIIALGDGADRVMAYLNDDDVWECLGGRIRSFANVGGQFSSEDIVCDGLRGFLRDRARAFVPSSEPLGTVLSGPDGNPNTTIFTQLGCPVFSSGEAKHVEMLFISSHTIVLNWLREVALAPADYRNPEFVVNFADPVVDEVVDWDGSEEIENAATGEIGESEAGNENGSEGM
ncbi:hypothetical protein GGS21DRAFT_493067 [Xylaria nigripes]|nr:hypothetical protein GGS21DRAFT_493067 [Xylaria nigripes]